MIAETRSYIFRCNYKLIALKEFERMGILALKYWPSSIKGLV